MKRSKRIISFLLVLLLIFTSVTGCGKKATGDSPYLSKREFINLFASETLLPASDSDSTKVSISKDDPCYDAAKALVEIGYMKDEELSDKLDDAVTKEFVATLCVRSLYFRKNFKDIVLKDAAKLADPEACRDAVGHEIVNDENGYFNAYKGMTYQDCMSAINKTIEIDSTSVFAKEDMEVEFDFKENVVDLSEDIDPENVDIVDPEDPEMQAIIDDLIRRWQEGDKESDAGNTLRARGLAPVSDGPIKVTSAEKDENDNSGQVVRTSNNKPKVCNNFDDAEDDELIVLRLNQISLISMKLEVGKLIVFGLLQPGWNLDTYNAKVLQDHPGIGYGEVLSINKENPNEIYILLRVASEDEYLDSVKLNKYSSSSQGIKWNSEQLTTGDNTGLKIGGFEVSKNGVKLTVKKTFSSKTESWRDPDFDTDVTYTFEIKNIGITVDGFGSVLKGSIDNAICRLDYTIVNQVTISQESRYTPDDNRNGKFLNNLSRSRFTGATAAGATGIKIARIYADLGYGFNVELYVWLGIQVDGTIVITLTNDYSRGFKIVNNKVQKIKETDKKSEIDINVNLEVTVNFDFSLRWIRRKGSPWADMKFYVGVALNCASKVFILNEKRDECTEIVRGYVSEAELKPSSKKLNIDYCFDLTLSLIWELQGLTKDCRIGKVIRFFDEGFNWTTGRQTIQLWHRHWEDGHRTEGDKCTRDYKGIPDEEKNKANGEATFVLDQYKIVIPNYCCGDFHILSYPVDSEKIDDQGGIKLVVEDENVCTAHMYKDYIVIEAVGEGSTQMKIMTGNGRYVQECSVTITRNEYD